MKLFYYLKKKIKEKKDLNKKFKENILINVLFAP